LEAATNVEVHRMSILAPLVQPAAPAGGGDREQAERLLPLPMALSEAVAELPIRLEVQPPPSQRWAVVGGESTAITMAPATEGAPAGPRIVPLDERGELNMEMERALRDQREPIYLLYNGATSVPALLRATSALVAAGVPVIWANAPRPPSQSASQLSAQARAPIQRELLAHRGEFRACYNTALEESPNLTGRLVIRFTVWPDGRARESSVVQDTLQNEGVNGCVLEHLAGIEFPAPEAGQAVTVTYPLNFRPEG
jgi:hypothetical protein